MSMLKVVLVDSDSGSRASLRRMLIQAHATVVAEYETISEALVSAASHRPDMALIEVSDDEAAADTATVRAIERLARTLPDTAILATGPIHSAEFVIQVMRAGAMEYLRRPVEPIDVSAALAKIARARRGATPATRSSHITGMFSSSGGVGVTTLAIALAMAMAENSAKRVLLLELDTRPSDIMTFLDIRPPYSVADALHNIDRMDESFIQGLVVKYDNGLFVLTAPPRHEPEPLDAERVQMMLEILRSLQVIFQSRSRVRGKLTDIGIVRALRHLPEIGYGFLMVLYRLLDELAIELGSREIRKLVDRLLVFRIQRLR